MSVKLPRGSAAPDSPRLFFSEEELRARRARVCARLESQGLDALLMFRQESMYYLTGYDTMGYITFQCMVMSADGRIVLLTREPDRRAARLTSMVEDVRVYDDSPGIDPARELADLVRAELGDGCRLGVEYDAFGLSARRARLLDRAFDGHPLTDASDLVSELRLVKSPAELAYVRRAADLADSALEQALGMAAPGVSEGQFLAAMQSAIFEGGGDYTASRWILGCGEHAMLVRHFTGHHNVLQAQDQLQLEFGAAYLHYHACLFHTVYTGQPHPRQVAMRKSAIEALEGAKAACRPGRPVGDMFAAYAQAADAAGYREYRLNACGYSLGATYPPTWMDGQLICRGNERLLEPGMVFFPHMVLLDSDRGYTGCAGETLLVTETGCEGLSRVAHEIHAI